MPDVIYRHEDWQHTDFVSFVASYFTRRGWTLPPIKNARNTVFAEVNQGRWIVECPARCGGAVCVSRAVPLFLCTECGSPENKGNWYSVTFPKDATAIEAVLLRRPERDSWQAATRNWKPGESLRKLKTENLVRGIREVIEG